MKLNIKEIAVFGVLGAIMLASKIAMEFLPNVHLIGVFIVAETAVYRKKALYPIYTFVLISGLYYGFAPTWWPVYLYSWAVLWGMVMLLPKDMPENVAPFVYMCVCALHGLMYGTLNAPYWAVVGHLSFRKMILWIASGLPFDAVHAVSNFFCAMLVLPLVKVMKQAQKLVIN